MTGNAKNSKRDLVGKTRNVGIVGIVGHAKTGVGVVGIVRIVGTAIGNHTLPVVPPMSRIYKSCDKIRQWSTTTRNLRSISCLGTTQ